MQENSKQDSTTAPRISHRLAKRRLKVFSSLVKEDSPNHRSGLKKADSSPQSQPPSAVTKTETLLGAKTEPGLQLEVSPPSPSPSSPAASLPSTPQSSATTGAGEGSSILEPSPPKQKMAESPLKARNARYRVKETTSLKVSKVTMDKIQSLQQALTKYGVFKTMDNRRIAEGVLVVNYFDVKSAVNAYTNLQKNWEDNLQIEYHCDPREQLTSINESSDSAGSEKSEENSENERKAREALETTKQKIKQEYEAIDEPAVTKPVECKTMPLPYISAFANPSVSLYSTCQFPNSIDQNFNFSDSSFDNDTLNEGIEVNYPRQFAPRPFPGIHSPPSTAIPTESTNMDPEDSFCKPSYLDSSEFGMACAQFCPSGPENQQFLRTQPTRGLTKPPAVHTHTRSYDFACMAPYVPSPYYAPYPDSEWYDNDPAYFDYGKMSGGMYAAEMAYGREEKHCGRTKHQETEESKVMYKISLRDILNGTDTRTTLMIKNIPNKYNQGMLLQKINRNHDKQYNFFYLPIDFKNNCNVGYAFINFVSPLHILRFYENMNAKRWEKFNSEKICQLAYARIQGLDGLLEHFHCSGVMTHQSKKVKPLILSVIPQSVQQLADYKKELCLTFTKERLDELESANERIFSPKQVVPVS